MMANLSIINKLLSFLIENSGVFRTLLVTLYIILILTWIMKNVLRTDVDALTRWFYKNYIALNSKQEISFLESWKGYSKLNFYFQKLSNE